MTTTPAGPPRTSDASADALGMPADVEQLHRDLLTRTRIEPSEGEEPTPRAIWVLAAATLFVGGFLLGRHWGEFGLGTHLGYITPGAAGRVAPELAKGPPTGEDLYKSRCAPCHQPNAQGVPGSFPPLIGSEWLTGDERTPIRILLDGLGGAVHVKGVVYNGNMPAWGPTMSDEEIALVLTYVRGLSNAPPVDVATVKEVRAATQRAEPWTEQELRKAAEAEPAGAKP